MILTHQGSPACTLTRVAVHATVVDSLSSVTLTQHFRNDDAEALSDCVYTLPVPAGAAVHACTLRTSDGAQAVAVVVRQPEALETFERARAEGKSAAVVQQHSPDSTSLPPCPRPSSLSRS